MSALTPNRLRQRQPRRMGPMLSLRPMRRIAPLLLAGSLALVPAAVLAHTELASADPADGSTISVAPGEVVLTFAGEVGDGSTFTVNGPSGRVVGTGKLDLEIADRNVLRDSVEVDEAGEYRVAWSVVGDDGHEVEGEVVFTYAPEGTPAAPDAPDTALPSGTGSPLPVIGGLLTLAAAVVAARRALAIRG